MLAKCANPECSHVFRYFGVGKLYRKAATSQQRDSAHFAVEHFWLCGDCAPSMTLAITADGKAIAVPIALIRTYREAGGRILALPEISPTLLELPTPTAVHV
jgi:hypothetical protein